MIMILPYKQKIKTNLQFLIFFALICCSIFNLTSCSKDTEDITENTQSEVITATEETSENPVNSFVYNQNVKNPNVLLIIADDIGMDATPYATQLNTIKPTMPHLNSLQENGVRFQNAWAYPRCTPTRGTILTGKHGYKTGLLAPSDVVNSNETTLQTYINTKGNTEYASAVIGKWHLAKTSRNIQTMGIDFYKGNTGGGLTDYYNWTLHEDGTTEEVNNYYGTTAYTDYAIDWINKQTKPWFCWLAYNAAHSTFHTPKDNTLYTHTGNSTQDMYFQMLEAMDSEIGRLLANIPKEELANTTIIFVGDNGTPGQVAQSPFESGRAKGSLYNGGINVPLVVSGANVSRANQSDISLIQTTDLFATIADLTGVTTPNIEDSISFKNILTQNISHTRKTLFAEGEKNGPAFGGYALRNHSYKLIYNADTNTRYLYNMMNDYIEATNLYDGDLTTEEQNAVDELETAYNALKN